MSYYSFNEVSNKIITTEKLDSTVHDFWHSAGSTASALYPKTSKKYLKLIIIIWNLITCVCVSILKICIGLKKCSLS